MFYKKLKTKSIIIGRRKRANCKEDSDLRDCFVDLFDINNPHLCNKAPKKIFEFEGKHKVVIKDLDVNYLLLGHDLLVNDLKEVEIKEDREHIYITGEQK